jgi:hypothetical protein
MSNTYRFPERGHVYRHCVMCGRSFRGCNSQLAQRGARLCTVGVTTQPCARLAKRLPVTGSDSSYIERHKRQRALWRSLEVFGVGIRRVVDAREKLKIKVMQQLLLKAGAFVVTASMVFGQQEQTNAPGDAQFSPLQLAERTMHRRAVEAPS